MLMIYLARPEEGGHPLAEGGNEKKQTLRVSDLVISDEHITVNVDENLKNASRKMLTAKVSIALVLDSENRVVGVLYSNDILDKVLEGIVPEKTPVSTLMVREFMKIQFDDDLAKVAPKIRKSGQKYVVVIDAVGKYKGFFSVNDLRHSREILYRLGYNPFEEGE